VRCSWAFVIAPPFEVWNAHESNAICGPAGRHVGRGDDPDQLGRAASRCEPAASNSERYVP
jgi:hypothetical protein